MQNCPYAQLCISIFDLISDCDASCLSSKTITAEASRVLYYDSEDYFNDEVAALTISIQKIKSQINALDKYNAIADALSKVEMQEDGGSSDGVFHKNNLLEEQLLSVNHTTLLNNRESTKKNCFGL